MSATVKIEEEKSDIVVKKSPVKKKPKKTAPKKKPPKVVDVVEAVEEPVGSCLKYIDPVGDPPYVALKKLYISNRDVLDYLDIETIDSMSAEEAAEELSVAGMVVSNTISMSLTDQVVGAMNKAIGYLIGLGDDFDDHVKQDNTLMKSANNILNEDLLCYLSYKVQFCLLYGSKVIDEFAQTKKNNQSIEYNRIVRTKYVPEGHDEH